MRHILIKPAGYLSQASIAKARVVLKSGWDLGLITDFVGGICMKLLGLDFSL